MILLTTSLILSVIMIALFALSSFSSLQKLSAQTRYLMWVILLIGLVIPFRPLLGKGLITLEQPVYEMRIAPKDAGEKAGLDWSNPQEPETDPDKTSSEKEEQEVKILISRPLPAVNIPLVIWAAGALVLFIKYMIEYREFRRIIKRWGEPVSDPAVLEIFEWIKAKMGLEKKQIGLLVCRTITTPMLTGILQPTILLPEKPIAEDEMELILEHELTHYKHKDLIVNLIGIIALCFHWFNPLLYICLPVIYGEGESYCDETVLKNKDSNYRRFYGEVIISMIETGSQKQTAFTTCFYAKKLNLKKRLSHIMDSGRKMKRISFSMVLLMFCLTLVSGSIIVFAAPGARSADEKRAAEIAAEDSGLSSDSGVLEPEELTENPERPAVYEEESGEGSGDYEDMVDAASGERMRSEREKEENRKSLSPSEKTSVRAPAQNEIRSEEKDKTADSAPKNQPAKTPETKIGSRSAESDKIGQTQERETISAGISEKKPVADSSVRKPAEEKEERKPEKETSSKEGKKTESTSDRTKDSDDDEDDDDEDDDDRDEEDTEDN